jgi:hypothetical protein
MYNGLLRFNKHILNELAEGLKHLPNLDGVSKGDSLIINEQGNPAWGSAAFIPTFENAAYGIEWTKDDNDIIRIGNAKFHRELPIQNRLKGCVYYELGNYNTDGSNLNTYPAVYRGILNFFGDICTFIRDVAIINRNANYNSVYLLKKDVNHSDVTIDNIQDKCYFIGDQANTNNFITEFDFRFGPYFVPNKVGNNKKADYNWIRGNNEQDTDKAVRVLRLGGCAKHDSRAGSGFFNSHWVRSASDAGIGFFTTVKLD